MFWPHAAKEEPISPDEYRDRGLLASAVGRPFQTIFGEPAYPTICSKAAALFHSLICNHPFANGNKRTAVLALDLFLCANNRFLFLDNNEIYELAKKTARYRELGIDHETSFREVHQAVRTGSIHFNRIRTYKVLHRKCQIVKRAVRSHELNATGLKLF